MGQSGNLKHSAIRKLTIPLSIAFLLTQTSPAVATSGEGGARAADFLMGLAAVFASFSSIPIAKIEADANKAISRTNAQAQIRMTEISAQTSEKLAQTQQSVARENAGTQREIAFNAQSETTNRLNIQVAQMQRATIAAQATQEKRLEQEKEIADRRLALAEKNLQITSEMAERQRQAALTANGLSPGGQFIGVTVNRAGLSTGGSVTTADPTAIAATNGFNSANGFAAPTARGAQLAIKSIPRPVNTVVATRAISGARGLASEPKTTSRLLASVVPPSVGAVIVDKGQIPGARGIKGNTLSNVGAIPLGSRFAFEAKTVGRALNSAMVKQGFVRGSTNVQRFRVRGLAKATDLDRMMERSLGEASEEGYRHRRPSESAADPHGHGAKPDGGGHRANRAPASVELSRGSLDGIR